MLSTEDKQIMMCNVHALLKSFVHNAHLAYSTILEHIRVQTFSTFEWLNNGHNLPKYGINNKRCQKILYFRVYTLFYHDHLIQRLVYRVYSRTFNKSVNKSYNVLISKCSHITLQVHSCYQWFHALYTPVARTLYLIIMY